MSNSNRFMMDRMAFVILVSGFILVPGGCASGPPPPTLADLALEALNHYTDCLHRADIAHDEHVKWMTEFAYTHPEITFKQWDDLRQLKWVWDLEKVTAKEQFILGQRIDNDKHRPEWCELTYQSQLKVAEDLDRELQRLQPRLLYIVP